jgi:hypothetical protein
MIAQFWISLQCAKRVLVIVNHCNLHKKLPFIYLMSLVRDDSSFWAEKINGATTTSHRIEEYYFFLSSAPYPVSRIEFYSNESF